MTNSNGQGTPAASERPSTASADNQSGPMPYDQKEEAAKAIRFMLVKGAIFILIPIIASILAIVFLL
nr:phosphoribosylformylglycinamidine synthase-associated small membrane protein [uncultured Cohaesibacter sp.]